MIRSLKQKVFWSILLSAAGVLLVILLAINVLRMAQTASKRDSVLDAAPMLLMPEPGEEPGMKPGEEPGLEPGAAEPGMDRGRDKDPDGRGRADLLRSVSEGELGVVWVDSSLLSQYSTKPTASPSNIPHPRPLLNQLPLPNHHHRRLRHNFQRPQTTEHQRRHGVLRE